jgi:hypothetical protein
MAVEVVPSYVLKLRELQECARRLHGCILGVAAISRNEIIVNRVLLDAVKAAQDCDMALDRAQRMLK